MRDYRLYGLTVRTGLPLSPSAATNGPPDMVIDYAGTPLVAPRSARRFSIAWRHDPDSALLRYDDAGGHRLEFLFTEDATRLAVRCTRPEATADVTTVLIGPGMVAALHLRGARVFHGAAVLVGAQALLILGTSGTGKSTLTAALCAAGGQLVTEEVAVIDEVAAGLSVRSGYPRMSLNPDALRAIGRPPEARAFPNVPDDPKCVFDAAGFGGGFCDHPAPLGAVVVLRARIAGAQAPIVTRFSPARAALALLDHTYGRHWLGIPPDRVLAWTTMLARRLPVYDVALPDSLDELADAARIIRECAAPAPAVAPR